MKFALVFLAFLVTTTDAMSTTGTNVPVTRTPYSVCDGINYYGPSGVISSPNYPGYYGNNLACHAYIYASTGSSLAFIFTAFSIEECCDEVIFECYGNSSLPDIYLSGHSLPDPVSYPWCSQAYIHFHTDSSATYSGFSLDYYVSTGGCGNTVYNASSGYVSSPNYPSYYGYNQNCSNIIWARQRSTFSLYIEYLNTQPCCSCDWLEISCMDNSASGPYLYCGSYAAHYLYFYGCSQVLLWFHTDGSSNYPGFRIQYNVYPDQSSSSAPTTPTPQGPTSAPTAGTTVFVPQNCGNTSYYGPSGVISSPNYPGNYSNSLSCDYYVNASSSSSSIAIIFKKFDTQECCDYVTISCQTNPIYPSVRYSGSTRPQPFSIPSCSRATVNFSTDSSVSSIGFSLDYYVSLGGCGDTVYTGSHGYISSPNYPNSYDNNQNCSNIIWARRRSSFSITFQYMNVEECCDFVELRCLDNVEYGPYRFTGTSIPPKQDIPGCTQVLVWFYADDSVVQTGFNLEYTVTLDPSHHRKPEVPHGIPNTEERRKGEERPSHN